MLNVIYALTQLTDVPPGLNEEKDCICPRCPSYPDCAADPELRLFCMRREAPCPVQRRGCICPGCRVHAQHHFTRDYYCDFGTEKEQTGSRG